MKKTLLTTLMAAMVAVNASAQSDWTLNTRAWCTNYFTGLIYNGITQGIKHFVFEGYTKDSLTIERIIPQAALVFPVGMGKSGFDDPGNIYGPYHRAFSNPIKHIGDYAIGLDLSYKPLVMGVYAGAYFKSQEIVYKSKENLRGFYFQPRAGLVVGGKRNTFEAGVFYDVVTGYRSSTGEELTKDIIKGGLGLDFALSSTDRKEQSQMILQFSMPLHNFIDDTFPGMAGKKRKVGYIMCTRRIFL